MANAKKSTSPISEKDRMVAATSYVWIACLYGLLFRRDSAFIQHHAKQGLALFVVETLSWIFLFLAPLVIILCVIFSIWGAKSAYEGTYWMLPFVGDWIKKNKI